MPLYVVYVLRGITALWTTTRRYVGLVQLEDGEGADEAVERRRQQHARLVGKRGALFLRICHSIEVVWKSDVLDCSPVLALARELHVFLREFTVHGFTVRGACFASILIGPGSLKKLEGFTVLRIAKLESSAEFPVVSRHLRGACFHCGSSKHLARDCQGSIREREAWAHNPAEFPTWGDGVYWNCHWQCWQYAVRNKKKNKITERRAYVKPIGEGVYTVEYNGKVLYECGDRVTAVNEAREHLAQLSQGSFRSYEWAPRLK